MTHRGPCQPRPCCDSVVHRTACRRGGSTSIAAVPGPAALLGLGPAPGCTGPSRRIHSSAAGASTGSDPAALSPSLRTGISCAPGAELMQLTGEQSPANQTARRQAPGRMGFFKSLAYTLLMRHPLPPYSF